MPNADAFSEAEIRRKYEEFDRNDPIDLASPQHMVFIGEIPQGQAAGLVWLCHREPFWRFTESLTWIYNLHVLPRFRQKGLATMLLKTTEDWTTSEGLHLIGLHVLERNTAARALYESRGYTLVATHKESYFYEKALGYTRRSRFSSPHKS